MNESTFHTLANVIELAGYNLFEDSEDRQIWTKDMWHTEHFFIDQDLIISKTRNLLTVEVGIRLHYPDGNIDFDTDGKPMYIIIPISKKTIYSPHRYANMTRYPIPTDDNRISGWFLTIQKDIASMIKAIDNFEFKPETTELLAKIKQLYKNADTNK